MTRILLKILCEVPCWLGQNGFIGFGFPRSQRCIQPLDLEPMEVCVQGDHGMCVWQDAMNKDHVIC